MVSVPCRSRLPVFGSLTVEYETVPGRLLAFTSENDIVPVGAIVGLSPPTVAVSVALDPAFTEFGEDCRFTVGVGNPTKNVVLAEVEG
jgi:hypothetical protein